MLSLFLFRCIFNPLLVQTAFAPDEYWQSLEVAHRMVYGFGIQTWEWKEQAVRGFMHPSIFALLFQVLQFLHLDYPFVLILAPMMLQGACQYLTDMYTFHLANAWFNNTKIAHAALLCSVLNWFNFYCGVRTFSNSLETTMTVIALYYLVSNYESWWWLFWVGFGCAIRPTNALVWLPIILIFMLQRPLRLITHVIPMTYAIVLLYNVSVGWLCISIAVDSYFYGRLVFVIWNFVKFNFVQNLSHLYGVQPWHWYFSQGLLAMVATQVILMIVAWYWSRHSLLQGNNKLMLLVIWAMIAYSIFPHKEFRFIFPILPLCMVWAGYGLWVVFAEVKKPWLSVLLTLVFVPQLIMAFFFCFVHQRGGLDAMTQVRMQIEQNRLPQAQVFFLMPCHHTPGYSHMHLVDAKKQSRVTLRHLDCSPNFTNQTNFVDEADRFYEDPAAFVRKHDWETQWNKQPTFLVMYEGTVEQRLLPILKSNGFTKVQRIFHMFNPEMLDRRMNKYVTYYAKK